MTSREEEAAIANNEPAAPSGSLRGADSSHLTGGLHPSHQQHPSAIGLGGAGANTTSGYLLPDEHRARPMMFPSSFDHHHNPSAMYNPYGAGLPSYGPGLGGGSLMPHGGPSGYAAGYGDSLGIMDTSTGSMDPSGKKKKRGWKKPSDMPKRPLSAYNLFFRQERKNLLGEDLAEEYKIEDQSKRKHRKSHGKIGFKEMAQKISSNWKNLSEEEKRPFTEAAQKEQDRYKEQMVEYKKKVEAEERKAEAQRKETQEQDAKKARTEEAGMALASLPNAQGYGQPHDPHHLHSLRQAMDPHSLRGTNVGLRSPSLALGGPGGDLQELRRRRQLEMYELHLAQAAQLREELRRSDSMPFGAGGFDDLGISLSSRGMMDPMNISGRFGGGGYNPAGPAPPGFDRLLAQQRAELAAMERNRRFSTHIGPAGGGGIVGLGSPYDTNHQPDAVLREAERRRLQESQQGGSHSSADNRQRGPSSSLPPQQNLNF